MELEEALELGVIEFAGFDEEDGEPLYVVNLDKAKELAPTLYWEERNAIDIAIQDAVNEGYLDWDIDPVTLEETLTVTEVGAEAIKE